MKRKILIIFFFLGVMFSHGEEACAADKYLVILQAGVETHEGVARAVHALLYSKELKESGHEVVLLFDGAGTAWVKEWAQADPAVNKLAAMYQALRDEGLTQIVCDYCSSAFKVKESLEKQNVPLTAEYQGHPSIVKWLNQGYQLIIL